MALYVVHGVHLNEHGQITLARIQQADGQLNKFISPPTEQSADDVANMIAVGDSFFARFIMPNGLAVTGSQFRRITYGDGAEGIELIDGKPGQTLQDLMQF